MSSQQNWVEYRLLDALRDIFISNKYILKEYELIQRLQQSPYHLLDNAQLAKPLALFRCHFILFHHLYLLNNESCEQKQGFLEIHTTKIQFHSAMDGMGSICKHDPMQDYYLNWENLNETNCEDVEELLADFWRKMHRGFLYSDQQKQDALKLLSIEEPFSLSELKQKYRAQQHRVHPDKGGSLEDSQALLLAYDLLRLVPENSKK